jgi:hypothetical protein
MGRGRKGQVGDLSPNQNDPFPGIASSFAATCDRPGRYPQSKRSCQGQRLVMGQLHDMDPEQLTGWRTRTTRPRLDRSGPGPRIAG